MQLEGMLNEIPKLQFVGKKEESIFSNQSIVAVSPSLLLQATGMKVADASMLIPSTRNECLVMYMC